MNEIVRGYMKTGVYYPAKGEIVKKELYNFLVDNEQKNYSVKMDKIVKEDNNESHNSKGSFLVEEDEEAHILLQSVNDILIKNICLNEEVGEFIGDVEEHKEDEEACDEKEAHILLRSVNDILIKNICLNEEVGEFIGDVEEHKEDEAVLLQNVNENTQDILKTFRMSSL